MRMKFCNKFNGEFLCSIVLPEWAILHEVPCCFCRVPKPRLSRAFLNTVGSVRLLTNPIKFCEDYGRWVWVVSYPGKQNDIMNNFESAVAHANYVAKNPNVMRPMEK